MMDSLGPRLSVHYGWDGALICLRQGGKRFCEVVSCRSPNPLLQALAVALPRLIISDGRFLLMFQWVLNERNAQANNL